MDIPSNSKTNYIDNERLWKERAEIVPDWIWEMDLRGVYTYSNGVVERMLGYEAEEIIGKTPMEIALPISLEECRLSIMETVTDGSSTHTVTFRAMAKDGAKKVLEANCIPIWDDQKNIAGFRGVTRDISDREAEQQALREAEEHYRIVVENAPTAIFIVQDERIVFINQFTLDLMGFTLEEAMGLDI